MRDSRNIQDLIKLDPDFMGFIFYPPSPRNAIGIERKILEMIPERIKKVGVFVDSPLDFILDTASFYGIGTVQLHGYENRDFCINLKSRGYTVIKAIKIGSDTSNLFDETEEFDGVVDLFLFDTAGAQAGGTGIKFNWDILAGYSSDTPFLLSGGIGPDDISLLKKFKHNKFAGIDVNSKFEISPGRKKIENLSKFIKEFRS